MTKRLQFPNFWAEGGTATDPDLDTTAPSFKPDRYENIGWESEKPPEDWQNFLSQITDQKILDMLIGGLMTGQAGVPYRPGAIYKGGDGNINVVVNDVGVSNIAISSADLNTAISFMMDTLVSHQNADNPHNDTVNTLVDKSYEKPWVDAEFGSPYYPSTIIYHQSLRGLDGHNETAEQTGALHNVRGGSFTGTVTFQAYMALSADQYLHYNSSNGLTEIVKGTYSLGAGGSGNAYIAGPSGITLVISEANLLSIVLKYNNLFALPVPVISANFLRSLHDGDSVGNWIAELGTETPTFEVEGGVNVLGLSLQLTMNSALEFPLTAYTRGKHKGVWRYAVAEYPRSSVSWGVTPTVAGMLGVPLEELEAIEFIQLYPTLSEFQKSMLVMK